MISSFKLSNKRATKDQPDMKTTSTLGAIQFSQDALKAMGVGPKQYLLFFSLGANDAGLSPSLPDGEETVIIMQGVDRGDNGQVGNLISDAAGKFNVSSAFIYENLGGNDETLNEFDITEAHYGFIKVDGKYQPITANTPNDLAGTELCAYVTITNDKGEVVDIAMADVAGTVEAVKASAVPFFPVVFVASKAKQVKGTGDGTAKAPKAAKADTAVAVDLADFEDEEEVEA